MTQVSLGELAIDLFAELHGDPNLVVSGVAEMGAATTGQLALLTDRRRLSQALTCQASALIVPQFFSTLPLPQLVCRDCRRALGVLLERFGPTPTPTPSAVDSRAAVDRSAAVDPSAWVGPFCYIGPQAAVGPRCRVEPFTYIGPQARIGADCTLGPGATVAEGCSLADGVIVGPGAVIGFKGFGYWRDDSGWHSIPSRGAVRVESLAEIGANCCVDGGTLGPTHIGQGVKIDNLVQVGHNAQIGDRALICAQVGVAGSVEIGEDCLLAGQVGVGDHRTIGRGATIGGKSGVAQDVPPGACFSGYPAIDHKKWLRSSVLFGQLADLTRQLRELKRQLAQLISSKED